MGTLGDLKAQQLILLAVFVSFVTSIATGITTVSLMESAPQPVQQVVNRVVEKTIERVVPAEGDDQPREKEIVTTVVKEEDLMVGSVEKNSQSVVRIYTDAEPPTFATLGLAVGQKVIVADAALLANDGVYRVTSAQGSFKAKVAAEDSRFAVLEVTTTGAPALVPASIADPAAVKLAQSVIAISGEASNRVAVGAVASAAADAIVASVSGTEILPGAVLVNLRGDVVGVRVSDGSSSGTFAPAAAAKAYAESLGVLAR